VDAADIDWDTLSVNFNNFAAAGGEYAIKNGIGTETLNAENNWWDDDSGPTHAGNPGGIGDIVSNNVDYTPWLGAPLDLGEVHYEFITDAGNPNVVDATAEAGTIVTANITPDRSETGVYIGKYESQPFPDIYFIGNPLGIFIDIFFTDCYNVIFPVYVQVYYDDDTLIASTYR